MEFCANNIEPSGELAGLHILVPPRGLFLRENLIAGERLSIIVKKRDKQENILVLKAGYRSDNTDKFLIDEQYEFLTRIRDASIVVTSFSEKLFREEKVAVLIPKEVSSVDIKKGDVVNVNAFYVKNDNIYAIFSFEKEDQIRGVKVKEAEKITYEDEKDTRKRWKDYLDKKEKLDELKKSIYQTRKSYDEKIKEAKRKLEKMEEYKRFLESNIPCLTYITAIVDLLSQNKELITQAKAQNIRIAADSSPDSANEPAQLTNFIDFEEYCRTLEDLSEKVNETDPRDPLKWNEPYLEDKTLEQRIIELDRDRQDLEETKEEVEKNSADFEDVLHEVRELHKKLKEYRDKCRRGIKEKKREIQNLDLSSVCEELLTNVCRFADNPSDEEAKKVWSQTNRFIERLKEQIQLHETQGADL